MHATLVHKFYNSSHEIYHDYTLCNHHENNGKQHLHPWKHDLTQGNITQSPM